jgi:hypothetical protein
MMKQVDLDRYRKSRQSIVEAGKYRFTVLRPTKLDVLRAANEEGAAALSLEFAIRFVVGWEGVTEMDLYAGGDPDPVAFEAHVFKDWLADQPKLWAVIAKGIGDAYKAHEEATEARGNVSGTG